MTSLDDSIGSPKLLSSNESNKIPPSYETQQKKVNKRTPLTEKANNLVSSSDKKHSSTTSYTSSDKQTVRNLSTIIK